jgi:1,4-alpha-glucan branching enzyme
MKNPKPARKERPAADDQPRMQRTYSKDNASCRVTFWLPKDAAPDAASVAVAGSFNDWSLDRHPMKQVKSGDFQLALDLEAGKEYEFRFVIDGVRWENAWNADKYVWNEHAQCENSVVAI